jgi:hypothetical protein
MTIGAALELACTNREKKKKLAQACPPYAPTRPLDPSKNHINLVCHGMMLFLYDRSDTDHLTILVPRPPDMMNPSGGKHAGHVVALSEYRAGYKNRLADPSNPAMYRQGAYDLVLEATSSVFARSKSAFYPQAGTYPSKDEDVVLCNDTYPLKLNTNFQSSTYSPHDSDPIWFGIKIPYPTYVFQYSIIDLQGSPAYGASGDTVMTFGIAPKTMGGVHVFYYENVQRQANLRYHRPGSSAIDDNYLGPTQVGGHLNLHLYSQPAIWDDYGWPSHLAEHLQAFNAIASYGNKAYLDLSAPNLQTIPGCVLAYPVDKDFVKEDYDDLAELLDGPKPPWKTVEPVECLQCWGGA